MTIASFSLGNLIHVHVRNGMRFFETWSKEMSELVEFPGLSTRQIRVYARPLIEGRFLCASYSSQLNESCHIMRREIRTSKYRKNEYISRYSIPPMDMKRLLSPKNPINQGHRSKITLSMTHPIKMLFGFPFQEHLPDPSPSIHFGKHVSVRPLPSSAGNPRWSGTCTVGQGAPGGPDQEVFLSHRDITRIQFSALASTWPRRRR